MITNSKFADRRRDPAPPASGHPQTGDWKDAELAFSCLSNSVCSELAVASSTADCTRCYLAAVNPTSVPKPVGLALSALSNASSKYTERAKQKRFVSRLCAEINGLTVLIQIRGYWPSDRCSMAAWSAQVSYSNGLVSGTIVLRYVFDIRQLARYSSDSRINETKSCGHAGHESDGRNVSDFAGRPRCWPLCHRHCACMGRRHSRRPFRFLHKNILTEYQACRREVTTDTGTWLGSFQ